MVGYIQIMDEHEYFIQKSNKFGNHGYLRGN